MIWIIGEYAERIDNADELLEQFLETFPEETSLVNLRLEVMATAWDLLRETWREAQHVISGVFLLVATNCH